MNSNLNNELSIHRPAWTSTDLEAYKHLHIPIRRDGKTIAAYQENHFVKSGGLARIQDRREFDGTI